MVRVLAVLAVFSVCLPASAAPATPAPAFVLAAGHDLHAGFKAWLDSKQDESGAPAFRWAERKGGTALLGPGGRPLSTEEVEKLAGYYAVEKMGPTAAAEPSTERPGFSRSFFSGMLNAFMASVTVGGVPRTQSDDPVFQRGQAAWDVTSEMMGQNAAMRGGAASEKFPWRREK